LHSVAHEVAVIATGARPGKAGERELFTEETTTVLVFENGGVLRLAAAVVPGQLLFLTHKETRREVVAQVTRKRDFRPTSCYVEVEFSEPSPGFWGVDFPATPQLVPATAQQKEAAELVHSAKVIPGKSSASAPSAHEVAALKQEVEALREQLKFLQTQTVPVSSAAPVSPPAPADTLAPVVIPDPPPTAAIAGARSEAARTPSSATANALDAPSSNLPSAVTEIPASAAAPPVSAALPIELGGPSFSEALHAPKPEIRVNRTNPKENSPTKPKVAAPGHPKAQTFRSALLAAALMLVATGAAWYLHWIPGLTPAQKSSAGVPPSGAPSFAAHPASGASAAPLKATDPHSDPGNSTLPSDVSDVQPVAKLPGLASPSAGPTAVPQVAAAPQEAAKLANAGESAKPSALSKAEPPVSVDAAADSAPAPEKSTLVPAARRSELRPPVKTTAASATLPSEASGVVPPKLVKSVRAIASPNALEYFAHDKTATVTLDAVVDATGRVKSMKVLSGPVALRDSAIEALKQYRYEPATSRGKPVAGHVTVPIKFLFEP
jgi:protein TonB